jgi:hypothetical protein
LRFEIAAVARASCRQCVLVRERFVRDPCLLCSLCPVEQLRLAGLIGRIDPGTGILASETRQEVA